MNQNNNRSRQNGTRKKVISQTRRTVVPRTTDRKKVNTSRNDVQRADRIRIPEQVNDLDRANRSSRMNPSNRPNRPNTTNVQKRKRARKRRRTGYNINIGTIMFLAIFLYISINCIFYIFREKISIYEVVKGKSETIQGINTTGVILRNEAVTQTSATGYVNYYVRDGGRVAVGNNIYSVDENGAFSQALKEAALNDTTLSSENIAEIKTDIKSFVSEFNSNDFSTAYDFKYHLDSKLIESINLNALETVNQTIAENGGSTLVLNKSTTAGIVELYTDGYEGLTPETLTADSFDKSKYKKNLVSKDNPVEAGSSVYKTITDENWQIVIPLSDEEFNAYANTEAVDILFPTENLEVSANFREIVNGDAKYGVIDLKRYMVRFADKRFVDIQIKGESVDGLKVPTSAVTQKDFYTIPIEYLTTGGDSNAPGFLVEKITESGESATEFNAVSITKQDDTLCYVDHSSLKEGTVLIQPSGTNKYQIGLSAKLDGVYNVNNGLTTFRYINIISEKNGYYIVESGSKYGLQVYDQIVLNAKLVKDNQIIFK